MGINYRGIKKVEKIGKVKKDVIIEGIVKAEISEGEIYEGQFIGGFGNSFAKITFPSGNYYIGMFKIIRANGDGKLTHADGTFDEGWFDNGKFIGVMPEETMNIDLNDGEATVTKMSEQTLREKN